MKRFYFSGQRTFGNRGCEAIVRSTVGLLREQFGEIEVLVPSDDIGRDSKQWPEASRHGVQFVKAYTPAHTRYWVHLQRLPLPFLKRAGWPFPMPAWLRDQISSVDAVLAVGGDNYSLDYRLPSLLMGVDKLAMDLGKPVILWGASVGPFEREPYFVPAIKSHLVRMSLIGVRESVSLEYLTETLGLKNVVQMADPAFTLEREKIGLDSFWPANESAGVLGLNVSPLIERYRKEGQDLRKEATDFIRRVVNEKRMPVLLIPHVVPLNGEEKNNDAIYMRQILDNCADLGNAVKMMPDHLNASQIKEVISHLRFFIGARTHATIAAHSSGVPTVSIAYSVKAKGINKDLFGNENSVVPTPDVSSKTLMASLEWMLQEERVLRKCLASRIPELQAASKSAARRLMGIVYERKGGRSQCCDSVLPLR